VYIVMPSILVQVSHPSSRWSRHAFRRSSDVPGALLRARCARAVDRRPGARRARVAQELRHARKWGRFADEWARVLPKQGEASSISLVIHGSCSPVLREIRISAAAPRHA